MWLSITWARCLHSYYCYWRSTQCSDILIQSLSDMQLLPSEVAPKIVQDTCPEVAEIARQVTKHLPAYRWLS